MILLWYTPLESAPSNKRILPECELVSLSSELSRLSSTNNRPSSSKASATGVLTTGSAATNSRRNPGLILKPGADWAVAVVAGGALLVAALFESAPGARLQQRTNESKTKKT